MDVHAAYATCQYGAVYISDPMEDGHMTSLIDKSLQHPNALQNIGIIDRTVRIIIGLAMISVWFFYPISTLSVWLALIPLAGALTLLSGILGWCPVYALFGTKSCGVDERNTCGTYPDQLDHLIHPHDR
jgi:hypothetical protein